MEKENQNEQCPFLYTLKMEKKKKKNYRLRLMMNPFGRVQIAFLLTEQCGRLSLKFFHVESCIDQ
jgi:hypothetical protein